MKSFETSDYVIIDYLARDENVSSTMVKKRFLVDTIIAGTQIIASVGAPLPKCKGKHNNCRNSENAGPKC